MKTPSHNYNTPEEGTVDWHIPLNENFEKLDTDIEIRGPEAEKGEYEPKEGTKYEAVDSGAVYYGDGDAWVLADRQVDAVNTNILSAGKLFNDTYPGTAIVAPSVPSAYDKIQHAIDDGFYDVWLCENVEEGGIILPEDDKSVNPKTSKFRLRGMSQMAFPVIIDPQNGEPVIQKLYENDTDDVVIENIAISGGSDSEATIDLRDGSLAGPNRAAGYVFRNVYSSGGPWRIGAGRHTLINCRHKNVRTEPTDLGDFEAWPSLTTSGATFAMYGGKWTTYKGDHNTIIGSGAFSITGGVTFNNGAGQKNPDTVTNGAADLGFEGAGRGFIGGISCEMGDIDIRMGLKETDNTAPGLEHSVIAGPSMGGGDAEANIEINKKSRNVTFMNVNANKLNINKNARGPIMFINSNNVGISATGSHLQDLTQLSWGSDGQLVVGGIEGDSYTQLKEDILSSEPDYPVVGASVIADGKNWDPQGTGNAAKVIYNGTKWIVDTDLESPVQK